MGVPWLLDEIRRTEVWGPLFTKLTIFAFNQMQTHVTSNIFLIKIFFIILRIITNVF